MDDYQQYEGGDKNQSPLSTKDITLNFQNQDNTIRKSTILNIQNNVKEVRFMKNESKKEIMTSRTYKMG